MSQTTRNSLHGVLFMIASMFLFSLMNNLIHYVSHGVSTPVLVFWRNALGMLIMAFALLPMRKEAYRSSAKQIIFWRALVGLISMELWFYALAHMPLSEATALNFTAPIFTTIFAILFLGEKGTIARWAAVLTGFAGTLVILRPDTQGFNEVSLIVLVSSAIMAWVGILIKNLAGKESTHSIVFFNLIFMTPLSLIPALPYWAIPDIQQMAALFLIALIGTISHFCLVSAFARAEMLTLIPFDFTRLIFTAIMAYYAFGEVIDIWTIMGGAIIISAVSLGTAAGTQFFQNLIKTTEAEDVKE